MTNSLVNSQSGNGERVILITPTFRDEKGDAAAYRARYEGLISLYRQFQSQDYDPNLLELRIADASEVSHPFFEQLKDPRVKYLHLPTRSEDQKEKLKRQYPFASSFLLTDEDLLSEHNRLRISALQQYCSKRIDPISAQSIPSIRDPLESPRPSIGMKRNVLCALPFGDGTEKPDIIIAMDDDDWRSPDYVKNTVESLQHADWTKRVNYELAIVQTDGSLIWGKKEFVKGETDSLPSCLHASPTALFYHSKTGITNTTAEEAFKSPRWHPLSTDGTVHALRYKAWERTVQLFDGYAPVSYNEDTLMFESLRLLGHMKDREEICRHPLVLRGLTNGRVFSQEELDQDQAAGPVSFNPQFENRGDFVRLCCANVSPVAFSRVVPADGIAHNMLRAFEFMHNTHATYHISYIDDNMRDDNQARPPPELLTQRAIP